MKAANLENIDLYNNDIGPDGCEALIKGNWAKIARINLRNNILTKKKIQLEMKDVIT